jgi:hypothetical protein
MEKQFSIHGILTRRRRPEDQVVRSETVPEAPNLVLEQKVDELDELEWFRPSVPVAPATAESNLDSEETGSNFQAIYAGISRLAEHSERGSVGMSAKFDILDIPSTAPHPFRGIKVGNTNGQRVKLMVCTTSDEVTQEVVPVYNGEAIVSWWSEDARGMHVGFKLDDGLDGYKIHPFKEYSVGDDGQMMTLACWPITEQEVIVPAKAKRGFNQMTPTTQSQIMCKNDEEFQAFCFSIAESQEVYADPDAPADKLAAEVVYAYCGVNSRSELTKNEAAKEKWNTLLTMFRRKSGNRRN